MEGLLPSLFSKWPMGSNCESIYLDVFCFNYNLFGWWRQENGWGTERYGEGNAWTSGKDSTSLKHRSMPAHHTMCDGSQVGLIRDGFFKKALYELALRRLIQLNCFNMILWFYDLAPLVSFNCTKPKRENTYAYLNTAKR